MERKASTTKCGGPSSNVENIYFSIEPHELTINTTLDLVILSAKGTDLNLIHKKLKKYFKRVNDYRLSRGKFKRKSTYENDHGYFDLLYNPKSKSVYMQGYFLIILHQPNTVMMGILDQALKETSIFPTVNKIELAWDFYGLNPCYVKEFLQQHLFLRYQRSPSKNYKNTFYTNDLRRSVKGVRLYPRPKYSKCPDCVRLELEIHRPKIKKLNIAFPIKASDLDLDFRNYFEFRKIDFRKVMNFLIKRHWKYIAKIEWERPGFGGLIICQFESACTSWADMPLMEAIEDLRTKPYGIENYSRFLVPMGALNMMIEDAAYKQRFQLS